MNILAYPIPMICGLTILNRDPFSIFRDLPLYENETVIDTLTEQSQLTTQVTERSVDFIKRNKDHPFFPLCSCTHSHMYHYLYLKSSKGSPKEDFMVT